MMNWMKQRNWGGISRARSNQREWEAGDAGEEVVGEGQAEQMREGEQVCRWVWQTGDGERRESLRTSGGRKENVRPEEWRMWLNRSDRKVNSKFVPSITL